MIQLERTSSPFSMVTRRIFKAFKHITKFSLSGAASVYDWHIYSFKMISTHETMITEASAFIQNPILEEGESGEIFGRNRSKVLLH